MKVAALAVRLGCNLPPSVSPMADYIAARRLFLSRASKLNTGKFQSPSITPSTHTQRSVRQNTLEHSVYQRADYTPVNSEKDFNSMFGSVKTVTPKTVFYSSGMAAISTLMFYIMNTLKHTRLYMGENAYFETKWLAKNYPGLTLFNEYEPRIPETFDVLWFEYPINCTQPTKYPFNQSLKLKSIINLVTRTCRRNPARDFILVIDYTLYYLPLDIAGLLDSLPKNLRVFLVTSLQKHRGYGLDLFNAGAVSYYSHNTDSDYEELTKLRTIMGTGVTQETIWSMPRILPEVINRLIKDSGQNTKRIFEQINRHTYGPVSFHFSDNPDFYTSFIFVKLDKSLYENYSVKPYTSDLLIEEIVKAARKNHAVFIHGTSFGLPFSRIFKNSERYDNATSLRIAVGFDSDFNKNVAKSIIEGTRSFLSDLRNRPGSY